MFGLSWTSLLNPKVWIGIAIALAVSWAGAQGYNWIWERGYDKKTKEVATQIASLTKKRDDAVTRYQTYKNQYDTWVATTKNANEQYLKEQYADLEARQKRLAAAEKAQRDKPTSIKEVIKYVPAEVDATYRLPAGFISLYRQSIEGRSAQTDPLTGLPQGLGLNVGEASGIAVSQFGQIAASNNAECVVRGKVIEEWQGWYSKNAASFESIRNAQNSGGPQTTP